jgi:hypothetical protein
VRLRVHRSAPAFIEALRGAGSVYYATFGRSGIEPTVLHESEAVARERRHRNLSEVPALRPDAERLLRAFFGFAARADPQWRYAHSSRVPLAIPDYADVGLIFLLRALDSAEPDATVHALVEDPWHSELVRFVCSGAARPRFAADNRRGLARAARSLARRALVRRIRRRCEVLVLTLGDSVPRTGIDTYMGEFAAALADRCAVHTVFAAAGTTVRFPPSELASPIEAFLRPRDVAHAWKAAARLEVIGESADAVMLDYLRAREHASGEVLMQGLFTRLFENMIEVLAPKTLVYPLENRSWEKRLVRAARGRGVRCVGYQHSSITPRHLAFTDPAGSTGTADLPDVILTCGEVTADLIRLHMPRAEPLVKVGAALRTRRIGLAPPAASTLLAPISSSRAEAWEILRVLSTFVEHCDMPVLIRAHPTIPMADLYAQFSWPARVRLSAGGALAADIANASVIAYSSSTVALEGMLYGRLPVFVEIGDVPSGDPIHGEHDFVFRASCGRELADVVERIRSLTAAELERLRNRAREYVERYLIEPTPERVARMADIVAPAAC